MFIRFRNFYCENIWILVFENTVHENIDMLVLLIKEMIVKCVVKIYTVQYRLYMC